MNDLIIQSRSLIDYSHTIQSITDGVIGKHIKILGYDMHNSYDTFPMID